MKLAVLGLGFMGSTHLKALRGVLGAELAAVYSHDERKLSGDLTAVHGNLGGPGERFDFSAVARFRELDALLLDPGIDAVDICLPTDLHEPVTLAALQAGKHVLVEKPMALNGEAADRMIHEAGKHGRVLMTAQVLRFFPEYLALEEAMLRPELGAMRCATFRRRCGAPTWGAWLKDPSRSGGGAFDVLIHDVDMCLHLFGIPEAVSATGYADSTGETDYIQAAIFYTNGGVVAIAGGWLPSAAYPFSMEYSVTLDGGTIEFSSSGRAPALYGGGAAQGAGEAVHSSGEAGHLLPLSAGDGYASEIAYFVECCLAGKPPVRCPPQESATAVKLMRLLLEARNRNGEKMPCKL